MQPAQDQQYSLKHADDNITETRSGKKTIEVSESTFLSPDYDENCSTRGLAVLVQNFDPECPHIEKLNSQCNELMELLQSYEYGLEIFGNRIHENLTKDDLYTLCSSVAKDIDNNENNYYYCLLFVILGHGSSGIIRCKTDTGNTDYAELSKIMEFFQPQNCAALALKPKVFIVQTMEPKDPNQADALGMHDDVKERKQQRIPRESDFLTYTSDEPCYLSDNKFLNSIVKTLDDEQKTWYQKSRSVNPIPVTEIQSLLIKINRNLKETNSKVPYTTSSLTRKMYLQKRTFQV
ncbi:caspase-14-like [Mytilus californianus]|uniref:caspase-14-like n=1 Tax=Mytilus californianus TaxID=6549 RepID=UPI002247BB4C|nr:caspase-14-like [Mytilus californianus]XP_052065872.1 caspase-14-like [Mytilus californianus]XP_052065873.1 caspase-14-like [Mytilus californianus]